MTLVLKMERTLPHPDQHNIFRWVMGPLLLAAAYLIANPMLRWFFMRPTARVIDNLMRLGLPEEDVWIEAEKSIWHQTQRHWIMWHLLITLTWADPNYIWRVLKMVAALEMHERGADIDVVEC